MNAEAVLKSQGWRGKGHSLHATDNSIGLAKPLLLSRNADGRGVGTTKHFTSDQWWLTAFDQKLKGLDTSQKGVVVQSVTAGKLDVVKIAGGGAGKYKGAGGLYASFVRGGTLQGTLEGEGEEEATDTTHVSEDTEGKRRKGDRGTKEERRARKEARRLRREARAKRRLARAETARSAEVEKQKLKLEAQVETKADRMARKAEKRARKEARRKRRED